MRELEFEPNAEVAEVRYALAVIERVKGSFILDHFSPIPTLKRTAMILGSAMFDLIQKYLSAKKVFPHFKKPLRECKLLLLVLALKFQLAFFIN